MSTPLELLIILTHHIKRKRKNHWRTPNYENRESNLSLTKWIFYDGMRKLAIFSSPIYCTLGVSYFNVLFSGNISYSWLFHTESRFKTIRRDERWQKIQTCLNIFGSPRLQTRKLDITGAGNPFPLGICTRSLFLFYHTITGFSMFLL